LGHGRKAAGTAEIIIEKPDIPMLTDIRPGALDFRVPGGYLKSDNTWRD